MNPATNQFNQLLEQYIFKVANHHIDSADSATQPGLIDLWRTVSATVETDESLPALSPSTEWGSVLQQPVDWHSVDTEWFRGIIRERNRRHAKYLSSLKQAEATTHLHLQAVQASQLPEHQRNRLTAHYQRTLLMYQRQLARAERLHASYFTGTNPEKSVGI